MEQKAADTPKLSWPNRITLLRIILVPLFIIAAIQVAEDPVYRYVALGVFALLALGDAVDGWLARRLGQQTQLGSYLDPIADKLLLAAACVLLACPQWPEPRLPKWVSVIVVSRDVYLLMGAIILVMLKGTVTAQPSFVGKATTFLQMGMVSCTILGGILPRPVLTGFCYAATIFTLMSWVEYTFVGIRQLNGQPDGGE